MDSRVMDIRISEEAFADLEALQRRCRIVKSGALFLHLLDAGIRPSRDLMVRTNASRRTRLTLPIEIARDVSAISQSLGVPTEVYLDAFLRQAATTLIPRNETCPTTSQPSPKIPSKPLPKAATSCVSTERELARPIRKMG